MRAAAFVETSTPERRVLDEMVQAHTAAHLFPYKIHFSFGRSSWSIDTPRPLALAPFLFLFPSPERSLGLSQDAETVGRCQALADGEHQRASAFFSAFGESKADSTAIFVSSTQRFADTSSCAKAFCCVTQCLFIYEVPILEQPPCDGCSSRRESLEGWRTPCIEPVCGEDQRKTLSCKICDAFPAAFHY